MKPLFPVLDGSGSFGIIKATEGFAAGSVTAAIPALVAKDSSGGMAFLSSPLRIEELGAGTLFRDRAEVMGTGSYQIIAQMNLDSSVEYANVIFNVSSLRDAHFYLYYQSQIIADAVVGPGNYTARLYLPSRRLNGDGTDLFCYGKSLNRFSMLRVDIQAIALDAAYMDSAPIDLLSMDP